MPGAWAFSATLQRGRPTHWHGRHGSLPTRQSATVARWARVSGMVTACASRAGCPRGSLRRQHSGVPATGTHRICEACARHRSTPPRATAGWRWLMCAHVAFSFSWSSSQLHVCSCGAPLARRGSCAGRLVLRARTRSLYASSLRYRARRLAFTRSRQSFQYSRSAPALARRHASRAASAPSCVSGTAGPGCMPFSTSCVERKVSRAAAVVRAERTDVFEALPRAITVESADLFRR
jgi:hypothetical protein